MKAPSVLFLSVVQIVACDAVERTVGGEPEWKAEVDFDNQSPHEMQIDVSVNGITASDGCPEYPEIKKTEVVEVGVRKTVSLRFNCKSDQWTEGRATYRPAGEELPDSVKETYTGEVRTPTALKCGNAGCS
jgi:hypothetical protein